MICDSTRIVVCILGMFFLPGAVAEPIYVQCHGQIQHQRNNGSCCWTEGIDVTFVIDEQNKAIQETHYKGAIEILRFDDTYITLHEAYNGKIYFYFEINRVNGAFEWNEFANDGTTSSPYGNGSCSKEDKKF